MVAAGCGTGRTVQAIYGEEFALILADLHALPSAQPLYAARYIIKPAQGAKQGEVGTGGTPFTV